MNSVQNVNWIIIHQIFDLEIEYNMQHMKDENMPWMPFKYQLNNYHLHVKPWFHN